MVKETLNQKWSWWPLFPLYPYGKKKTILRELIPNQIWSLEQIQGLYYVAVPIRMTVIKVDNGLMLINPLPPTKELINELEKLIAIHGKVKTIILPLSLIHISEPTRHLRISYAVFCLKKKTTDIKVNLLLDSYTATNTLE